MSSNFYDDLRYEGQDDATGVWNGAGTLMHLHKRHALISTSANGQCR